jgi:hypothetical protein
MDKWITHRDDGAKKQLTSSGADTAPNLQGDRKTVAFVLPGFIGAMGTIKRKRKTPWP